METVCDNILKYNVHAERSGSLRYAKGESQTMGTLKGLVSVFFCINLNWDFIHLILFIL